MLRVTRLSALLLLLVAAAASGLPHSAFARTTAAFKQTLSDHDLKVFEEYIAARSVFDFKLDAYAREALALGLTKSQVVRIYALETSGLGTADMVAGIHPITKKGSPISTAIGYAQLLAANTINEIRKSGPGFIERLEQKARQHPE